MKKTFKTDTITVAYIILKNASVAKMKSEEKFAVIKAMRVLKPVATVYQDMIADTREKLKPENAAELETMEQRGLDSLSAEERERYDRCTSAYKAEVDKALNEEAQKEVEIDIEPISDEALGRFADSNENMLIGNLMTIAEVIGE